MEYKPLAARVQGAFPDAGEDDFAIKYLDWTLQNWRDAAQALRRTSTALVVLLLLFQVVVSVQVAEVSIGPLKLGHVSGVAAAIPAVVAFLLYELWVLVDATANYYRLRSALVRSIRPAVEANDLDLLLAPSVVSVWENDPWFQIRDAAPGRAAAARVAVGYGIGAAFLIGGCIFLAYAYWRLFHDGREPAAVVWVSLVFSLLQVVRLMLALADDLADDPTTG